jgi:hypothetical protein
MGLINISKQLGKVYLTPFNFYHIHNYPLKLKKLSIYINNFFFFLILPLRYDFLLNLNGWVSELPKYSYFFKANKEKRKNLRI